MHTTTHMLHGLLPRPAQVDADGRRLEAAALEGIRCPPELIRHGMDLRDAFRFFGKELRVTDAGPESVRLGLDPALGPEGWAIEIAPARIDIRGGDPAGVFYAVSAMTQLVVLAFTRGAASAAFDCGAVRDRPRFGWRGFMLDSVRHFQPRDRIKQVIRTIADLRLNTFHWHLSDSQGLRLPSALVAEPPAPQDGRYSKADVDAIVAYAAERFVRIVPEIDMPGHSAGILRQFPQFACDPARPGNEYCLGNPEARAFLKALLDETLALFPASPVIHVGGDEAGTAGWEQCPKCREALNRAGLTRMRELENRFMNEMTRHIVARGRQPMVWCTESVHPRDTVIQAWQSVLEIVHTLPRGNPIVNSVHYSCYFDYPAHSGDARAAWMPELSEESVYLSIEPPGDAAPDQLLGTEACLWTEIVPEWRVLPKMNSRLAAFAEHAWTRLERKDWHDFQRRKMQLEAAGYGEYLRARDARP